MVKDLRRSLAAASLAAAALVAQDDPRVQWLGEHAVRVASIDPAHASFDDLEPLKEILGDARVVQLGEQSHGDGAVFLTKTRLVRFLHEEMGFDVLAFESGLYDCRVAWQELKKGGDPVAAMEYGVFPIWMRSAQVEPLARYLGERVSAERPLELCGFDCQFTGKATAERLVGDLQRLFEAAPDLLTDGDAARLTGIARSMRKLDDLNRGLREPALTALERLEAQLADDAVAGELGAAERAHWRQLARSFRAYLDYTWNPPKGTAARINARDAQMGENMIWLANEAYAGRKIIVWAATMHLVHDADTIDTRTPVVTYDGIETMGHHVHEALGDDVYTLGFVAHHGEMGLPWTGPRKLAKAQDGSFEDLCVRAGLENALVSFRGLPADHWLRSPLVARPLGHAEMRADWTGVVDGFFFHEVMTASAPREQRAAPAAAERPAAEVRPLLVVLAEKWKAVGARVAQRNPWCDKARLTTDFEDWCDAASPDRDRLKKLENQLVQWSRVHANDDGFGWRYDELLAHVARRMGDDERAREAMARALAGYPETDYADPRKHSSFQHLANQQARWLLADDGFDAAVAALAALVEGDRRMRYFFPGEWQRGLTAAQREALHARIAEAYDARAKRFPEFADEVKRFAAELK